MPTSRSTGLAAFLVACGLALPGCSGNSTCQSARSAAAAYVADYQVGTEAAAAFKEQTAALPTYPSAPSLGWVTDCDEFALPGHCTAADMAAAIAWEKALQSQGVGTGLPLGAGNAAVVAFENAVANPELEQMAAIRSGIPQPQRSGDDDVKLYGAVVDGNQTCFSVQERAQVKVAEGQ